MPEMPVLETARLFVRPFQIEDLEAAYRLFDIELSAGESQAMPPKKERAEWLEWTVRSYKQLATLHQPPYGDRAIVLKSGQTLIGACGFAPCLNAFEQMPNFAYHDSSVKHGLYSPEVGLFYAVSPAQQRRGYASEAAQALIDYAFAQLQLKRIIATTDYDNAASMAVMRKLGMSIAHNPQVEPAWLQVVGVLENSTIQPLASEDVN